MGAIALGSIVAAANAAPIFPSSSSQMDPNIVQVWGGCGWGFHPSPWGRCVPNRWGYHRYRPYWRSYYGGGGLSVLASPVLVPVLTQKSETKPYKKRNSRLTASL